MVFGVVLGLVAVAAVVYFGWKKGWFTGKGVAVDSNNAVVVTK